MIGRLVRVRGACSLFPGPREPPLPPGGLTPLTGINGGRGAVCALPILRMKITFVCVVCVQFLLSQPISAREKGRGTSPRVGGVGSDAFGALDKGRTITTTTTTRSNFKTGSSLRWFGRMKKKVSLSISRGKCQSYSGKQK